MKSPIFSFNSYQIHYRPSFISRVEINTAHLRFHNRHISIDTKHIDSIAFKVVITYWEFNSAGKCLVSNCASLLIKSVSKLFFMIVA